MKVTQIRKVVHDSSLGNKRTLQNKKFGNVPNLIDDIWNELPCRIMIENELL